MDLYDLFSMQKEERKLRVCFNQIETRVKNKFQNKTLAHTKNTEFSN